MLITFTLIIPLVLALNIEFNITLPKSSFYPNETIPINVSLTNREFRFAAKNLSLELKIGQRNYLFKFDDLSAGQSLMKSLTLPEQPSGTYVIRGILNYSGYVGETVSLETYNSFDVKFPEIKRLPRNIYIKSFDLPINVTAGKPVDASVTIANNGTIAGDLILKIDSTNVSFSQEAHLEPGEIKTISLSINFPNAGLSLVEAKVYAVVDNIKYFLNYLGKNVYVQETKLAKIVLDKIELVDESDNEINQDDTVKIKVYLKNMGEFSASSVTGALSSSVNSIIVSKQTTDYKYIGIGDSTAPDSFEIQTTNSEVGRYNLNLDVTYTDLSGTHTIGFLFPIDVKTNVCKVNTDCASDEKCENSKCVKISCSCGYIKDRECISYQCCSDSQCSALETCNLQLHACVEKSGCISVINNGDSKYKADIVFVGDGYTSNQELKDDVSKLVDYDGSNGYNGIMSVEPFKFNKNKFNIWMIKAGNSIRHYDNGEPYREDSLRIAAQCSMADYQLIISKRDFRSYCFFAGDCYISVGEKIDGCGKFEECEGRLVLHEFGHGFAQLADEYTETGKGSYPKYPNCASDTIIASQWWGDLINQGTKNIGYYDGCSYTSGNIRPTKNSIMRMHWVLTDTYYAVNGRHIQSILNNYK